MASSPAVPSQAAPRTSSRRCPGLQASLRAIDRVVTAQSHEDKQAQINELVAAFKGEGGDELLKACRAILRQRKARGQKLARGTTKPSSAPDYLIKSCLALFTGVDVSVFTNMTAEDNKNYFFLAFAGKPHYHYPQTQMPLPEFYDWIQKHYESLGRPLHRYPLPTASAEFIDWELEVGIYAYSKEGDDDGEGIPPETVLTQLIDRAHKVKIKLPKEFHCKVQDLGTTWSLKDNYGQHEAYLYNHATRMQRPCGSFFTCAEPEVQVLVKLSMPTTTPTKRARTRVTGGPCASSGAAPASAGQKTSSPGVATPQPLQDKDTASGDGAVPPAAQKPTKGDDHCELQPVPMGPPEDGTDGAQSLPM